MSFIRHEKIYRYARQGEAEQKPTSPATIVSMSLQPVIPSWVALQQRPRPLRRLRIASLSTLLLSSFQQPTATVTQIACLRPRVHYRRSNHHSNNS